MLNDVGMCWGERVRLVRSIDRSAWRSGLAARPCLVSCRVSCCCRVVLFSWDRCSGGVGNMVYAFCMFFFIDGLSILKDRARRAGADCLMAWGFWRNVAGTSLSCPPDVVRRCCATLLSGLKSETCASKSNKRFLRLCMFVGFCILDDLASENDAQRRRFFLEQYHGNKP